MVVVVVVERSVCKAVKLRSASYPAAAAASYKTIEKRACVCVKYICIYVVAVLVAVAGRILDY